MPGGPGKINEYNLSLTPEQRKESARKAAKAKRPKLTLNADIRAIARAINAAPAQKSARKGLEQLGLKDEQMTNAGLIAAAVFRAAFEGDMKAVEKWERYIGQDDRNTDNARNGQLADLIEGLREPCENEPDI